MDSAGTFGKNVKICRELFGLSQEELAEKTSMTVDMIKNIESGRQKDGVRSRAQLSHVETMSSFFGISPEIITRPNIINSDSSIDFIKQQDSLLQAFPIISTRKAEHNIFFRKACDLERELRAKNYIGKNDVQRCINEFLNSGTDVFEESMSNIITLEILSFIGMVDSEQDAYAIGQLINKKGGKKNKEILSKVATQRFNSREISSSMAADTAASLYFEISGLRENEKFKTLADFYVAASFAMGISMGAMWREDTIMYGNNLMCIYALAGNVHASIFYAKLVLDSDHDFPKTFYVDEMPSFISKKEG